MAIIFALIALIGWGTADIFGGLVARKINGYSSAFWSYIFSLILTGFYIPFAINQLSNFTVQTVVVFIGLIVIGFFPLMTLYEGIKVGTASIVGTIAAAFGAIVAILSIIFLGDKTNPFQILAIFTIIVGIFSTSIDFSTTSLKKLITDKGVPYALISLIGWGVYFTLVRIAARQVGWFWPAYFSWLGYLPLVYIFARIKKVKLEFPRQKQTIIFLALNVVLICIGSFAYNFATTLGQTTIVGPIASSYPILFASLAYFVFQDRLKKQQIFGIVLTLIGIILLAAIPS